MSSNSEVKKSMEISIDTVLDYLEGMVKFRKENITQPPKLKYICTEDFVLQNGRPFEFRPLPKHIAPMEMKECYRNSFQTLIDNHDLTYCEGFATSGILPVLHAFLVDMEGYVVDPTWTDGIDYYGVPFKREFVISQTIKQETYGLIDNWSMGYPLLSGEIKKEEWFVKELQLRNN